MIKMQNTNNPCQSLSEKYEKWQGIKRVRECARARERALEIRNPKF